MLKATKLAVAGLLCLMLLATPAFAASPHDPPDHGKNSTPLNLNLVGIIVNAGDQRYSFSGGQLASGLIGTDQLSPGQISFSMSATVHGLTASGRGSLQTGGSHDNNGNHFGNNDWKHSKSSDGGYNIQFSITGMIPAAVFPLTPSGNCDPNTAPPSQPCNSEIPFFFTGLATIQSGDSGDPTTVGVEIESPYMNPFGGPIVIASPDGTLLLVVTYTSATIGWSGVQLQGQIAGTFGQETVGGYFSQVTYSQENLVAGTEFDGGSIIFTGMSDAVLNAHGAFFGRTTIPTTGEMDCSGVTGVPGTCTETGAISNGSFWMIGGQGAFVSGTYSTIWSVPSLSTATTVMGAVVQH